MSTPLIMGLKNPDKNQKSGDLWLVIYFSLEFSNPLILKFIGFQTVKSFRVVIPDTRIVSSIKENTDGNEYTK